MYAYIIETIDSQGRTTHCDRLATLPEGVELGAWEEDDDGDEVAFGRAPAYLGGQRVGWASVRVTRYRPGRRSSAPDSYYWDNGED